MKKAYTLLGIAFLVVFVGAFLVFERANAPSETSDTAMNNDKQKPMELTSPNFENNGLMPAVFTCDGSNVNPELHIGNIPAGTGSLVLVMDDPDIPKEVKEANGIEKFNHWAVYNLPADMAVIPIGLTAGNPGLNGSGEPAYIGPCPPREYQPTEHRYSFRVYALPDQLNFITVPTLDELETAAKSGSLDSAELIGRYER